MTDGNKGRSNLQGWEIYPENLAYRGCDAYGYDCSSYRHQIRSDAERLFIPHSEKFAVKIIEFNTAGAKGCSEATEESMSDIIFREACELEDYLKSISDTSVTRLILIPQQSSWGRLVIDESSIRKILTSFNVFPPFIDVVRAFGEKTGFEDDSYGGLRFRTDHQNNVHETAYLVKHVEEHGRCELSDPWSIRQMGVYHKTGDPSGDVFIIINPSLPFRHRLKEVKDAQNTPSPGEIHLMIQSCTMEKWRWYISHLEKKYLHMKDKAQLTRVNGKGANGTVTAEIQFEDTQEIQVLQDKCQQLAHLLGIDRTVLQDMLDRWFTMTTADEKQSSIESELMSTMVAEANIEMRRVENLLQRLDGTIALIRTIVDFRCLASLQNNSEIMTEITRLSRKENAMMINLTERATRDTEIVKTLTILALVYLPASFVSSMMGMGYINTDSAGKNISIHFEGEFWVFLILTAILLLITLGSYRLWTSRIDFHSSMNPKGTNLQEVGKAHTHMDIFI